MLPENKKFPILLLCIIFIATGLSTSLAGTAKLSFVAEDLANPLKLSLMIDHAEKIAGMKVTIIYDKDLLTFKSGAKAKATSSFLHVINDKNPGKLIIVMASAKGITGDNTPLFYLEFTRSSPAQEQESQLSVTQLQLMDENLEEISANLPEYTFK